MRDPNRPLTLDECYEAGQHARTAIYNLGVDAEWKLFWYRVVPTVRQSDLPAHEAEIWFRQGFEDGYPPTKEPKP